MAKGMVRARSKHGEKTSVGGGRASLRCVGHQVLVSWSAEGLGSFGSSRLVILEVNYDHDIETCPTAIIWAHTTQ